MSAKDTEQRLIRVIIDHFARGSDGRLSIQDASSKAGISRQAFNRNYSHLKPYVLGKRPVVELLGTDKQDVSSLLTRFQARVEELQNEVARLQRRHEDELENVRTSYISTLMSQDITLHSSNELRASLEKQALHNEMLIKDVKRLQLELANERARTIEAGRSGGNAGCSKAIIMAEPDLSNAFESYARTKDQDAFEAAKDLALENLNKKLRKACNKDIKEIALFVDRYLCDPRKYAQKVVKAEGNLLLARVPIFSRPELKQFAKALPDDIRVRVHVPFCASEATVRAQRKFSFRDVPDIEFAAADQMAFPTIQDGYGEVTVFRVEQGD